MYYSSKRLCWLINLLIFRKLRWPFLQTRSSPSTSWGLASLINSSVSLLCTFLLALETIALSKERNVCAWVCEVRWKSRGQLERMSEESRVNKKEVYQRTWHKWAIVKHLRTWSTTSHNIDKRAQTQKAKPWKYILGVRKKKTHKL